MNDSTLAGTLKKSETIAHRLELNEWLRDQSGSQHHCIRRGGPTWASWATALLSAPWRK